MMSYLLVEVIYYSYYIYILFMWTANFVKVHRWDIHVILCVMNERSGLYFGRDITFG